MNLRILAFVFISILFTSCTQEDGWNTEGKTLYLKNKDAVMPVWVTGNLESEIFIITNHGGPGVTSGFNFHESVYGFQELEKKYALVYWDQRMSGNAKGDPDPADLTIEQHVKDLEKLVQLIKSKYTVSSLFMYGHSWGGGLSILYLGKNDNQLQFNGWIDEDGSIQDKYEMDLKREWIVPRAKQKYDETGDSKWRDIVNWWASHPNPTEADLEPYEHVRELEGYVYDPDQAEALNPGSDFERIFLSPLTFGWFTNQYLNTDFMAHYDFMPRARNINIPTLLIWGKEDGAVPVAAGDTVYSLLATPAKDKYLFQLDECGHSPHYEQPFLFYEYMTEFIEKYK